MLQFCPENPQDKEIRAKMAAVGIVAGPPWDESKLSEAHKAELGLGVKEGFDAVDKRVADLGKVINGWQVGAAQGDRTYYKVTTSCWRQLQSWNLYGNDPQEAMYPLTRKDGAELDGSKHNYTLTFAASIRR